MTRGKVFASSQTIYWPGDYSYVVDSLKGLSRDGKPAGDPVYRYNTGAILLASVVGLVHDRRGEVGTNRQEIAGETFESQKLGSTQSSLAAFVLLVGLLAYRDVEYLRPERENELIRMFERYAAGGLELLAELLATTGDGSAQNVLKAEIDRALAKLSALQIDAAAETEG
jgi:hypothetical protein